MLLIHPPLIKAGEPPAGIATLAASLRAHGLSCTLLDANIESQLFLLKQLAPGMARQSDTQTKKTWDDRVLRHNEQTLASLRSTQLYQQPDRYRRAVFDLNRLLQLAAVHQGTAMQLQLSLNNCQTAEGDLLDSAFLLKCAEQYQRSLFYPWFVQRIEALLAEKSPRFVGIALNFLSQAAATFALLGYLRAHFPQLKLLLGGGLISSWMSAPDWRNPFAGLVDQCIKGPGERPLLEILRPSCGEKEETHHDFAPDYTDLPWDDYFSPMRILPYAASRGCYWNRCSFCPEAAERNPYLPTAPEQVSAHLRKACANGKIGLIHLLDNALSPALLRHLAKNPAPASWYGFVRFHEQLADVDFCRALRASGCVLLKLGLESGSEEVLTSMRKGASLSLMSQVLRALHQTGISTYVYLLFGTPGESEASARLTLHYTVQHSPLIGFLNLAIFNMPKNSEESGKYPGSGFSSGDLSLYRDFQHPQGWNRRLIRHFLDREFRRQPAISAILRRDPPFFGSNHACFFSPAFPWHKTG